MLLNALDSTRYVSPRPVTHAALVTHSARHHLRHGHSTVDSFESPNGRQAKLQRVRQFADLARRAGLPPELLVMTALTEARLRNPSGGDRDSVGMFQQRRAWGSYADRHNPLAAARLFINGGHGGQPGALDYRRRFGQLAPTATNLGRWAQAVQGSAFPARYASNYAEARRLLRDARAV